LSELSLANQEADYSCMTAYPETILT
jgi:hypothetical protein